MFIQHLDIKIKGWRGGRGKPHLLHNTTVGACNASPLWYVLHWLLARSLTELQCWFMFRATRVSIPFWPASLWPRIPSCKYRSLPKLHTEIKTCVLQESRSRQKEIRLKVNMTNWTFLIKDKKIPNSKCCMCEEVMSHCPTVHCYNNLLCFLSAYWKTLTAPVMMRKVRR